MSIDLEALSTAAQDALSSATDAESLETWWRGHLGRKGEVAKERA